MSDEQRAVRAGLSRLRAELRVDRNALGERLAEVREVLREWADDAPDKAHLALAAVALHGWYTGLESLCERVLREIDLDVPRGERSHRSVLSQAMTEIEGLRPAVMGRELEPDLMELLSFRHFFRHAYAVGLDPIKIKPHLRRLVPLAAEVDAALDQFDAFLAASIAAVSD